MRIVVIGTGIPGNAAACTLFRRDPLTVLGARQNARLYIGR
jgi:predicted NAD/FAD-binding protein